MGQCEDLNVIEGHILVLNVADGMVEIETDTTIEKVYVTDDTHIVIESSPGVFADLVTGSAVEATLYDDDLIKLEVDND